jgi:hypothetical protein
MFSRNNFPEDKLNIENRFPFVKTIFLDQHEFVGNSGNDFSGYFFSKRIEPVIQGSQLKSTSSNSKDKGKFPGRHHLKISAREQTNDGTFHNNFYNSRL